MKRWMRYLGVAVVAAFLYACGGGGGDSSSGGGGNPTPQAKTTMLVYLLASDLLDGRGAERDLENMQRAASSKDVNVVVQIGGGKTSGKFAGVDMKQTKRYHLVPASGASSASASNGWKLEMLPDNQQPPQAAMNRTDTLRDFIAWGAKQYPAQQYSLTLWDHGGGPNGGFGVDHSYGVRDANGNPVTMSVADITSAIRQAGVHFELIGFDACLMSSLEVAAALQPYANYLVASEEVTTGWDWAAVVGQLVAQPLAKGNVLGKVIVQSYKMFAERETTDFTAYAVTDLQQVPALVKTLEQAAQSLQQSLRAGGVLTWAQIAAARHEAEDFQTNLFRATDLVDVRSFVEELGQRQLLAPALVQQIRDAIAKAVVFYDGGENLAYGLMMYFPEYSVRDASTLLTYSQLEFSPVIKGFIGDYAAFASGDQVPQLAVAAPAYNGAALNATLSSNRPDISQLAGDGYAVLVQEGIATSMQQVSVNGNQWSMAQPQLWPQLDGQLVSWLREGEDDAVHLIPVAVLSPNGGKLRGMLYALRDGQGRQVVKYFINSSSIAGSSASAMWAVDPGDEFYPLVMDTATMKMRISDKPIEAPQGDWLVTLQSAPAGSQVYAAAVDLVGNLKVSPQSVTLPAPQ